MHIFSLEYTTWFSKVLSCCSSSFPSPPFWKGSTVKFQPKSMWIVRQILKTLTWSTYLWKCFLLCLSILQNALVWVTAPLQWCFWPLASCVIWHLSFLCWDHLQSDEEMLDNTIQIWDPEWKGYLIGTAQSDLALLQNQKSTEKLSYKRAETSYAPWQLGCTCVTSNNFRPWVWGIILNRYKQALCHWP